MVGFPLDPREANGALVDLPPPPGRQRIVWLGGRPWGRVMDRQNCTNRWLERWDNGQGRAGGGLRPAPPLVRFFPPSTLPGLYII